MTKEVVICKVLSEHLEETMINLSHYITCWIFMVTNCWSSCPKPKLQKNQLLALYEYLLQYIHSYSTSGGILFLLRVDVPWQGNHYEGKLREWILCHFRNAVHLHPVAEAFWAIKNQIKCNISQSCISPYMVWYLPLHLLQWL